MKQVIGVAIESTANHLGLSVHSFDSVSGRQRCLASFFKQVNQKQSDLLIPVLDKLLRKSRVRKKDIGLVAVDVGPGSFTGVRVGVATARTLGQALDIPVAGIDSLHILAAQSGVEMKSGEYLAPWIPALQGELYFAVFDPQLKPVIKPAWTDTEEFSRVVGKFKKVKLIENKPLDPRTLGELGIAKYLSTRDKSKMNYRFTVPLYLQPSWAERKK